MFRPTKKLEALFHLVLLVPLTSILALSVPPATFLASIPKHLLCLVGFEACIMLLAFEPRGGGTKTCRKNLPRVLLFLAAATFLAAFLAMSPLPGVQAQEATTTVTTTATVYYTTFTWTVFTYVSTVVTGTSTTIESATLTTYVYTVYEIATETTSTTTYVYTVYRITTKTNTATTTTTVYATVSMTVSTTETASYSTTVTATSTSTRIVQTTSTTYSTTIVPVSVYATTTVTSTATAATTAVYGYLAGDASNGAVYYVYGGKRYWITSPAAFTDYGFSWDQVKWDDPAIGYPEGYDLNGVTPLPPVLYAGRSLIGDLSDGAIYYVWEGKTYWITSLEMFEGYGFNLENVRWVSHGVIEAHAPGEYNLDGTTPLPG